MHHEHECVSGNPKHLKVSLKLTLKVSLKMTLAGSDWEEPALARCSGLGSENVCGQSLNDSSRSVKPLPDRLSALPSMVCVWSFDKSDSDY